MLVCNFSAKKDFLSTKNVIFVFDGFYIFVPLETWNNLDRNIQIVWTKMTDDEQMLLDNIALSEQDRLLLQNFKHRNRRLQWLWSRYLLKKMLGSDYRLAYFNNEKPVLIEPEYFLSISHSFDSVAVAVSKTAPIGIDIEKIGEKILRIQDKILLDSERKILPHIDNIALHIVWGAKEAVYKQYYEQGISFFEDIALQSIDFEQKRGKIKVSNPHFSSLVNFYFKIIDGYLLVFSYEEEKNIHIKNLFYTFRKLKIT